MNLTFHSCVQNFIVVHNKKIRRMVHHFNNLGTQQLIDWFLASLASILMWPMFKEFLVLPLTYGAINELQKPLFYSSQVPFIYFFFLLTYRMFGQSYFCQFILLFNLFLLLFINFTVYFDTIYGFYCTILINFYFYL